MRRLVGLAFLASVLTVGGAHAQVTTCTNYVPGQVRCETPQPFARAYPPNDYTSAFAQPAQDPLAAVNAGARQAQEMTLRLNRNQVGRLMAAGRCDEAMQQALRYSDFDLAQQVKALCQK